MSGPIIQGWCPGALRPMASGDGLVVRVRARAGRLTPDQARGIADLAARFGNGLIDLSARANLQMRGVTPASHPAVIEGLAALNLLDATPQAEAMRNILVTPFWQPGDGTTDLAEALALALTGPGVPDLPGKFGHAIDIGPTPVLRAAAADIRVERAGAGLIVRADGAATGAAVALDQAVDAVIELARWFAASGGISGGRGRMAALIRRGAVLPDAYRAALPVQADDFAARPGLTDAGALVALAFGQMQAATLAALADLGPLRLTPWRMLLVEGAARLPDLPGLVTDADDPILRVVACTGAPGCVQALGPTRDLARDLAGHVPPGRLLHVSGCAKGCAHPGAADLTLTATATGHDLIRDGTAADAPHTRLSAAQLIAQPALLSK
ncbi:precorrin-3B synthase [Paracoccus sp. p3-h83]|uniref:precorrin-3B synthase n=1 Tax=Paracoccus sp. p3-h83 TaxID=3342805 RepID=UPI0035BA2E56